MIARRRRGSQALEFALLFPLLALFCSAVADYGLYYLHQTNTAVMARDLARAGASTNLGDACARVSTLATAIRDDYALPGATATATLDTTTPHTLAVAVTATYSPVFGLVPMPADLAFRATAHARMFNQNIGCT